VKKYRAP